MKSSVFIFCILGVLCTGCTNKGVKINDMQTTFHEFPFVDSLKFSPLSDSLLDEPARILIKGDNLIIQTFCQSRKAYVVVFSLKENRIINETIKRGEGPDEMLSCELDLKGDGLWLYDMSKMKIGFARIDSFLSNTPTIVWHELERSYYRIAMLNDSVMLGTNDFSRNFKIHFVNLRTGKVTGVGEYTNRNDKTNLSSLIDAYSCYVNVNPKSKDILLSYRYTDVMEIYDSRGNIKHVLQGPDCFDVAFRPKQNGMGKTKETRKAFVTSYVTADNIYLLYSGSRRTDKNWSYGSEIFVFSWDGKPLKKYILPEPVYTFAVDENKNKIYSYSLETEELLEAMI